MLVLPSPAAAHGPSGAAGASAARGGVSFQAQCKSAVALVNERRIEFVTAKRVRVVGETATQDSAATGAAAAATARQKKVLVEKDAVERLLGWRQAKKIGPGFANLGNTCYLNSVLQCLSYTPSLAQYLLQKDVQASLLGANSSSNSKLQLSSKHHNNNNGSGGGFCALRVMARLLQSVHGAGGGRVLQPKDMVMNIRHISKRFRIGRQEDSHEFFRLLLDSMQKSCLRRANIKLETHPAANTSLVHRAFGGTLKNSLKCAKCNYVSERSDDFLDLSLEINNGIKSVRGALKHFTAVETLDDSNAWKCSSCKQLSRAEKGMTIDVCPNVLVIQLKRFDAMFGKIKKPIEFPLALDLASSMSKTSEDRKRGRSKYELHGVLVHAGFSTDCGHYYAFVRGGSGQWYEMNDDCVRWVSVDTVLQQKAYMLFYSRVLPPSERPKDKKPEPKAEPKATKPAAEELGAKVTLPEFAEPEKKPVVAKSGVELDMQGFLSSLRKPTEEEAKPVEQPQKKKKTVVTYRVTRVRTPVVVATKSTANGALRTTRKRTLTPVFGGLLGRLHKYRPGAWTNCGSLEMTREVSEETVEISTADAQEVIAAAAAESTKTEVKPQRPVKVHFDPRKLKNIGVKNAVLFGQEVDKWIDDSSNAAAEADGESEEPVVDALAAHHDRVLNKLKQEDWRHRNAARQDYWDETLDAGHVKKLKKRKEFVPNQGKANAFLKVSQVKHKKPRF